MSTRKGYIHISSSEDERLPLLDPLVDECVNKEAEALMNLQNVLLRREEKNDKGGGGSSSSAVKGMYDDNDESFIIPSSAWSRLEPSRTLEQEKRLFELFRTQLEHHGYARIHIGTILSEYALVNMSRFFAKLGRKGYYVVECERIHDKGNLTYYVFTTRNGRDRVVEKLKKS